MIAAHRARWLALACCLLAFLLSIAMLDARSLWGDEAFSVWASKQPALSLIAGLDAQPPLYHLLLGAGRALWGESVFAVRYLSLCCAVALVAVGTRLGWLMGGPGVSIIVALILATSPILIYYAQEARMYALVALLAGGAMLVTVSSYPRAIRDTQYGICKLPSYRVVRITSYILLSLAALFAHFYTVGVLLVNALALGVHALRSRDVRRMAEWLAAHLAIALVFGAWFFGLQSRYIAQSAAARSRIFPFIEDIVANFGVGVSGLIFGMRADSGMTVFALALFALALLGLIGYWRRSQRGDALLILGWIVASLGIVSATAARSGIVSDFSPRYYLFALLPLALAAGGWLLVTGHRLSWRPQSQLSNYRLLPLVLVALIPALIGNLQLLDASWQKSRYAALVDAIEARAQPGDGVVLVNSDQFPLVEYYGPHDLPAWVASNDELNRDPASLSAELGAFLEGKPRVWLVNYGWAMALQPRSVVEQQLNAHGARIFAQGFQDASLALYDLRSAGGDAPVQPKRVSFGEHIKLVGVRERSRQFAPGEAITLDLLWQAEGKLQADYTVFMHLRRTEDGGQIAANDSPPMNGAAPTSSWTPGDIITDTRAIQIPADAQPGQYDVIIGWYQYPSFERLKVNGRDATEYVVSNVSILQP